MSLTLLYLYVGRETEWHVSGGAVQWVPLRWWVVYFGPLLAIASIAVSFVSIPLSLVLWLLLPLRNLLLLWRLSKQS